MRWGLTVWFASGKSKHSRIGIRYPMGMANSGIDMRQERVPHGDTEAVRRRMEESFDAMEFIGPSEGDTIPMKLITAESFGLKMKAVPEWEKMVYELKIPLHGDSSTKCVAPFSRDSVITLVLESTATEEATGGNDEHGSGGGHHGGGGGEGMGGGGGGMDGGGEGHRGGGGHHGGGMGGNGFHGNRHEPSEPFTVELRIKLAGALEGK
jgi:hypothetical protein